MVLISIGCGPARQLHGAANVVEAVGCGNDVVLVGLQNVAVHAALKGAGAGETLAVERDGRVGAERLQVDPVAAGMRRSQRAFPGHGGVGGQGIPSALVKLICASVWGCA